MQQSTLSTQSKRATGCCSMRSTSPHNNATRQAGERRCNHSTAEVFVCHCHTKLRARAITHLNIVSPGDTTLASFNIQSRTTLAYLAKRGASKPSAVNLSSRTMSATMCNHFVYRYLRMTRIVQRSIPQHVARHLHAAGHHPLLARLFAARGVASADELKTDLSALLPPAGLKGIREGARLLADGIAAGSRMLIVGDYDCDGATACAVGIRALRSMGANVNYLVPNRFEYGYGLTPAIVELAAAGKPDLLITVDNGIASIEGVARARALGMATLITDHHLPGESLPDADVIINPNQPGCDFPSKCIAGVGVMFYVAMALRTELRERGWFVERAQPEPNDWATCLIS